MSVFRKFERMKLQKQVRETQQKMAKQGKRLVQFKDKDGKVKVTAVDVQKPYRKGE